MNQVQAPPSPVPGAPGSGSVDALLGQAEAALAELDATSTHDQVAEYDRIHDALVQALARTGDQAGPAAARSVPGQPGVRPVPGRPGA